MASIQPRSSSCLTIGPLTVTPRTSVAAALRLARDNGIGHLPVVERGRSLSAGQRQLIALARAQLVDPAILVLDEATANLDLATEAQVVRAMGRVSEGRTTLLIAHRLQSAARADRIIVLGGGRVIEVGAHDDLIAAGGPYAGMWSTYLGEAQPAAS